MNNEHSPPSPEDKAFDQELRALYQASLLDEDFQHQLADSLRALPEDAQSHLREPEKALLQDANLTSATHAKLLDAIPACAPPPKSPESPKSLSERFTAKWRHWFIPPMLALPTTLVMGLLLGLLLPVLLQPDLPDDTIRGHSASDPKVASGIESTESEQGKITDEIRQQQQQWLGLIAELLRQGKVAQAREELQMFELLHPDYQPPSP